MNLINKGNSKFYLSRKVLFATLIHTILIVLTGLLIQSYFTRKEKENFLASSYEVFLGQKSLIEQEVYINSVIKETDNSDLPSIKSFLMSLKTLGFSSKIQFEECTQNSRFVLNVSSDPKRICFNLVVLNSFADKTSKLLYPLIVIFFLTALPIYFFMLYTVRNESLLQFKSDIIDEFRHNINSPLVTLQNYIESQSGNIHVEISHELKSKLALIKGHLQESLATRSVTTLAILDLQSEVESIVRDKQIEIHKSNKDIVIEFMPGEVKTVIKFNKIELNSILSNVLNNSINAIDKSGKIVVSSNVLDGFSHITISDSGRGIAPENLGKIFKKGFTLNTKNGTGSGLFQAKYKIEGHSGKISLISTLGEGTTVSISIPTAEPLNLLLTENRQVFILEDDELLKVVYQQAISQTDLHDQLEINFFSSPEKLYESAKNSKPQVIFILDSQIGEDRLAGVNLSARLFDRGYHNIYMHSSYSSQNFVGLKTVKGVIKKESHQDLISFLRGLTHGLY